jgi:hypothetical protein
VSLLTTMLSVKTSDLSAGAAAAAFPIKSVADLRDAPPGKCVHPLHAARIAEVAAVTLAPDEDPEMIDGRKTEQAYRDAFTRKARREDSPGELGWVHSHRQPVCGAGW